MKNKNNTISGPLKMVLMTVCLTFSQVIVAQNTMLTEKNCSGQISDLNCYSRIIKNVARQENQNSDQRAKQKAYYEGKKIILDTYDQNACDQVRNYLMNSNYSEARDSINLNSLCATDKNDPQDRYRTITTMNEVSEQYITEINTKALTNTDSTLVNETRNLAYLMVGTVGLIWAMPESVSKWDKNDVTKAGFFNKYKQNVTNPPVWDKDDFVVNYVGHPISGAAYYTVARNSGLTKMESFGYSVLMSTFFWEYGFEAFAEKPSIQDLIITPVIGSIMGEVFYQWANKIKNNDGRVLGSKKIGKVALFVLNPAQELSQSLNKVLGSKVIQNAQTELVISRKRSIDPTLPPSNYIGLQLKFQW